MSRISLSRIPPQTLFSSVSIPFARCPLTRSKQAKSGHPGTPMALAPLVYTLWNRVLRFDPQDPIWPNRDRFVLSNGHASMLLWSVLHLTGTQAVNARIRKAGASLR